MPVDRPTFHESWYRVAQLRPRLRSLVQSYRQHYRDAVWQVLRDPGSNKFYRLDESNYYLVGLLDGQRSVDDVWKIATEQLGHDAPTQGEVIQLLGQLYTNNLLEADLPPDVEGMFDRYRKRKQREVTGYLTNILFARIPLYDPDRLLGRWVGVLGWLFSPVGIVLWFGLIGFGGYTLLSGGKFDLIVQQTMGDPTASVEGVLAPGNLWLLYVAMVFTKLLHEFGHGICCKYFGKRRHSGGEVHATGVMLLAFMPIPYIDASSSWALRSKWQRAFVAAAGMYVELALAAVAAIVWANTDPATTINQLAFNVIFIASVTTLLFNANPLIRFDGYYILSDLIEMPNLAQRSKDYLNYLCKKYAYKVRRPRDPARTPGERPVLLTYGIASFFYRIFITVTIIWFVADKLFFIGAAMAVAAVIGFVFVPLGKFIRYLFTNAELTRTRGRSIAITAATLAVLVGLVGFVPVPEWKTAQAVVEPAREADIHARTEGYLVEVLPTGSWSGAGVEDGAVLFQGENTELAMERARVLAQLRLSRAQYKQRLAQGESAAARAVNDQIAALQQRLDHIEAMQSDLTIRAPFAGRWSVGQGDSVTGRYVHRGEAVGRLVADDDPYVRVLADQAVGPRLRSELAVGEPVRLRVRGEPGIELFGTIESFAQSGRSQLSTPTATYAGGGDLEMDPDNPESGKTARAYFELRVALPPDAEQTLRPGQALVARFTLPNAPIAEQAYRVVRQLIQRRFN
ncbi:MAG: PqqD family peptide modification chaperone [Planctomycetota bacterium]